MDNKPETSAVVDELKRLDAQIDTSFDLSSLKPIFYRLEEITRDYPGDFDVQTLVTDIKQHLMNRGMQLKQEGAVATSSNPVMPSYPPAPITGPPPPGMPPPPPGVSPGFAATPGPGLYNEPFPPQTPYPVPPQDPFRTTASHPLPPPTPFAEPPREVFVPPVRNPTPPPIAPAPPSAPVNWKKPVLIGGGIGLAAVLAIIGAMMYVKKKPAAPVATTPAAAAVPVSVATIPTGADVRVNDQSRCKSDCRVDLAPGQYNLMAVMPGYEQALQSVTVEKGHPLTLSLTLVPQAPSLKILTDLGNGGQVLLDGKPAGALQDGQLVLDHIAEGKHELKIVSDKGGEAKFTFQSAPGAAPSIQGPVTTKNLAAVLAAGLGNQMHITTSTTPMKVALDGNPVGDAGTDGIDLKGVTPGDHELVLNDGKDERKLMLTAGPASVLTAWINASTSGGMLVVNAGEDNATVFIDGKPYPRKTKRGQLWIPNLPPKDYKVKVVKAGFQDASEQSASVKKGAETRLSFKLQAIPQIAVLHITGGTAGAEVLIDNQSVGKIGADGTFSHANVAPGDHTLELRREQYASKTISHAFRPGETVELTGDAVVLERAGGTLRISVTPKEAQITIKHGDEARGNPVFAGSHSLPAGTYTLVAKAPGYADATKTVQIKVGESVAADLNLTKEGGGTVKPVTAKADWEKPGDWQSENGWLVHRGGNFVPFSAQPSTGTFSFSVQLLKGGVFKKRIQWRVGYIDDKNYIGYSMDKKSLESKMVVNGKGTDRPKIQLDAEEPFTLQIEVTPERIVHRLREGDQWVVIDTLPKAGANQGKFGFYIPGKDEVAISAFTFSPR